MTIIKRQNLRSRKRKVSKQRNSLLFKLVIIIACVAGISLFIATNSSESTGKIRSGFHKLHSIVKKYEVSGYGPKHPRAAFILVATPDLSDPLKSMISSVESILHHTDRNRILTIYTVFQEGVLTDSQKAEAQLKLDAIDNGEIEHWHGMTKHAHGDNDPTHVHESKVRIISHDSKSVSASRREAIQHVEILIKSLEKNGAKEPEEDIITVFVRPDSSIETNQWIDIVTHALVNDAGDTASTDIDGNIIVARKMSNAVSFAAGPSGRLEEGETKSVNLKMMAVKTHASHQDLKLTNSQTYPTPILDGAVTAMKLSTFLKFPVSDDSLDSHFASDLEMSFNLWMCEDGIDIVSALSAKTELGRIQHRDKAATSDDSAARLANTWMKDSEAGPLIFDYLKENGYNLENLSRSGKLTNLYHSAKKCRSFDWYMKEVNILMGKEVGKLKREHKKRPIPAKVSQTDWFELERPTTGIIPSKPLSDINKEIISSAKMIDLEFMDVSDGHKEDPHRGAMDEHGVFGYVHDPTFLKKNPRTFSPSPEEIECNKNDGNKKMLTQKVFVDTAAHQAAERMAEAHGKPRAKIFCLVYTVAENHDRINPILETWGSKCDGLMIASTETDRNLGTVNIPHEGNEEYNNIWQKVRSMWSYIYDNYYSDYDWFHIGGDDLYLIVENLRLFLESDEIKLAANGGEFFPYGNETKQLPLFLGRRFMEQGNDKRIFNSGGSGYTMNKAALKGLVAYAFPKCMPHLHTFAEDVMVAQCFRNHLNVFPYDTKDENGGERYMPFAPAHHLNYKMPKDKSSDWYANYSIDIKEGLDHCAARSVAFHYIKGPLMKRLHAILYGYCDS